MEAPKLETQPSDSYDDDEFFDTYESESRMGSERYSPNTSRKILSQKKHFNDIEVEDNSISMEQVQLQLRLTEKKDDSPSCAQKMPPRLPERSPCSAESGGNAEIPQNNQNIPEEPDKDTMNKTGDNHITPKKLDVGRKDVVGTDLNKKAPAEIEGYQSSSSEERRPSAATAREGLEKTPFTVVNRDTGQTYDLMKDALPEETRYSLFPSREQLMDQINFAGSERSGMGMSSRPGAARSDASSLDDDSVMDLNETRSNTESSVSNGGRRALLKERFKNSAGGRLSERASKLFMKKGKRRKDSEPQDQRVAELTGLVQVKVKNKPASEFADMALLQSVKGHQGAIWTLAFNSDGALLASGGQDTFLLVWRVSREARISREMMSGGGSGGLPGLKEALEKGARELERSEEENSKCQSPGPQREQRMGSDGIEICDALFMEIPIRRYQGHTADIIDISWSRTDFLLSASIDKTVRLWHATREDCLHKFPHADFVTGVDFHPLQEKLFVSGCFDKKIRLWHIPDSRVKDWIQAPAIVTATKFTPDGGYVIAGLYHGQIIFYQTDGLRYYTQVECRNRKGPLKNGRKVTGLAFMNNPSIPSDLSVACQQLLVTTNDSRLRLYRIDDYLMTCKYKGLSNDSMQIKASFSEDDKYVICGSENGRVFIWNTHEFSTNLASGLRRDRNNSYESFVAAGGDPAIATVAQFVHSNSVRHALRKNIDTSIETPQEYVNAMIIAADYNGTIQVYCRSRYKR